MLRSPLKMALLAAVLTLSFAGSALAIAPVVVALGPSSLNGSQSNLTGSVDPQDSDVTSVSFQWGLGPAAGNTFANTAAATPTTIVANAGVSSVRTLAPITGLTVGQTYAFRIVATNTTGPTTSAPVEFIARAAAKATATTDPAVVDANFAGATLNATINPNGEAVTYRFHYAQSQAELDCAGGAPCAGRTLTPTQNLPAGTVAVPVSFHVPASASIPPLTAGTNYFYRVVASTVGGPTATTNPVMFFTGVVTPPPVLLAPTVNTLPAADVTQTAVTLKGDVNPNGQATDYSFQFGTTTAYGATTQALAAGPGTSVVPVTASLINLQPGTLYHYRVTATNATGTTLGGDLTFTTAGVPPPPPPANTGPPTATSGAASAVTTKTGTMNGVVTTGGLETTYAFQYGTTTGYGTAVGVANITGTTPSQAVSFALAGLKPGVTYHYRVVASNSASSVVGADMTFRTRPVLVMQRMRATPANFKTRSRPLGTVLSFGLSGPGKVAITITQPAMGGRICTGTGAARRCLPAPSTGSHVVQRINVNGHRGRNSVRFTGRPGGKALANGEYFVTARASRNDADYGAIRSKTLRLKLHVVG
ncbi:MAG: hypothetical protein QOK40_3025 [Miltoncostaeaceae bacterium]|nr:hypothetical protein [Miltoncostaeaceae bacterium]